MHLLPLHAHVRSKKALVQKENVVPKTPPVKRGVFDANNPNKLNRPNEAHEICEFGFNEPESKQKLKANQAKHK
jgi:hypothetical protein